MNKIISLIIPTYNMEKYLRRCLDSVTNDKVSDNVEIIVVNDGSKDNSLAIAREYEAKRPNIVTIIDKPNGNYGSCVNAALKIAQGKYIKMLDADDWYDTDEFVKLVDILSFADCDMFITHYQRVYSHGKIESFKFSPNWNPEKVYTLNEVFENRELFNMAMHEVGFRTQLLRDINYSQTEGISYTDVEWLCNPLYYVKSVKFVDADVYRYFLGREGQTMDPKVVLKSLPHLQKSTEAMLNYRLAQKVSLDKNVMSFLVHKATVNVYLIYTSSILYMTDKEFSEFDLSKLDKMLLEKGKLEYQEVFKGRRKSFLIKYWRRNGKRHPLFVRKLILFLSFVRAKLGKQ